MEKSLTRFRLQGRAGAGATEEMPLKNMFWGDRYGKLKDPFGHTWSLVTRGEDVDPEEKKARIKKATAS